MRIYTNSLGNADAPVRKTTTEDSTGLLPDFQSSTDTVITGRHYDLLSGNHGQYLLTDLHGSVFWKGVNHE